jgi:dihydropyrimidinase
MRTLVANGTVVTARDTFKADVLIDGEVISAIGAELPSDSVDRVIDAQDRYVLPGGVDVHTHMEMPFNGTLTADTYESGTLAAAFGGTTTIVDFAMQPRGGSLPATLDQWWQKAEHNAYVDYAFHMVIRDLNEQVLVDMDRLIRDEGVTSFKLFMAYPGELQVDDGAIFQALRRAQASGGLICVHAENGSVIDVLVREALASGRTAPKYHATTRPASAEAEATARAIALAEMAGAPIYFVHLSCAEALMKVREARARGLPVYAETCPHYLFLTAQSYDVPGFEGAKFVMTPPLRAQADQDALWQGLANSEIQVVSTDHCPFCMKGQKDLGRDDFSRIPNGAPGVESRLSLMYDGGVSKRHLTLNRFVELVATNPAKLMGLYPRKGTIDVGSDADIVVFDPSRSMTISASSHHSRVDYSLYEGFEVRGVPVTVLLRGTPVIEDCQLVGKRGAGRFVKRSAFQMTG